MATKIGDIYSINVDGEKVSYFQYVDNDSTQLNSAVIRVFRKGYSLGESPTIKDIVSDDVSFYAHVILKLGVKLRVWKKYGSLPNVGNEEIYFRHSKDYGSKPGAQVEYSSNWYIWKVNNELVYIGALKEEYKAYDVGIIVTPDDIVTRIKTGTYDFIYPK